MRETTSTDGGIGRFANHRVAANLLMVLMILLGLLGWQRLNTQLFPNFEFDFISVNIVWVGASPEDIERSITVPVEQALKGLPNTRKMIARSQQGRASIFLEMQDGVDLSLALDDVKQRINTIRNLPGDAEQPVVQTLQRYSPIANLVLYSERGSLEELRPLARQMENELLARGIGRVDFAGMPGEEMAIQVSTETLSDLGMTLDQLADRIRQFSRDIPAGTVGRDEAAKQLRALGQRRDEQGFAELSILTDEDGRVLRLGDLAEIERRPRDKQPWLSFQGYPAIELQVLRTEEEDSLKSARIINNWLDETRPTLPEGVHLHAYAETWRHLMDRIMTLLKNGLTGLFLVVVILFLFLNHRVALWVTIGIPVSFMATLGVLWLAGGTINMISLFGLILALGIIVDDAIVVGEDTLTHVQRGESALDSAIGGARRMFWPVVASSLTTIAAFAPLAMMGGAMGKIAFDIPFVMICVILASLVECFLVLPGHLHHAFAGKTIEPGKFRQRFDAGFENFRQQRFRPLVERAIRYRYLTVTTALCAFLVAVTIVASGWLKFTFFPPVDGDQLRAVAEFTSGTDPDSVEQFMRHLRTTLEETDQSFSQQIVTTVVQHHRVSSNFANIGGMVESPGDEYGTLVIEVYTGNDRKMTNDQFIQAWRERIEEPPGLDKLTIAQPDMGPPGKPVEILLTGADVFTLKQAALEVASALNGFTGISNVEDDLPWGKEQLTFELTDQGRALGLTLTSVAAQLRGAFDGSVAQLFNDEDEEVEVRVMLPDSERNHLAALDRLPIIAPNGASVPLGNVLEFASRQGVDLLRRVDSRQAVRVSADLDPELGNANEIVEALNRDLLPALQSRYNIGIDYEGKLAEQAENLADIQTGLIIGLALIYLVLAWVFSAYSWPIAIMTAIMFGFTGAVIGHILMGFFGVKFSMFSIMGLFGLSGIIVNDSIVLISFYQQMVKDGMDRFQAIVEACVQRLRAVLLTSFTTIAGLTPILFEGSIQAQFLKPMAVSIVFGLAFGTVLILAVVPSMLMILEDIRPTVQRAMATLHPSRLPGYVRASASFEPAQWRTEASQTAPRSARGLGGSLWPVVPLLLLCGLAALTLLPPAIRISREALLPGALIVTTLALLLGLLGLALHYLRQHHQLAPGVSRLYLLSGIGAGLVLSLLLKHWPGPENFDQAELALSLWKLSAVHLAAASICLPLLYWSRRAAVTFGKQDRRAP